MSAGGVVLYESFTGADGASLTGKAPDIGGAVWSAPVLGSFQLKSNHASGTGAAANGQTINSGLSNCLITLPTWYNTGRIGAVIFRRSGTAYFLAFMSGTTLTVIYTANNLGSYVTVGTVSAVTITLNAYNVYTVNLSGQNIAVAMNGKGVSFASPNNLTATEHGLYIYGADGTTPRFPEFAIERL